MGKLKRIPWLDYTRAFAIICVILVHTTESLYSLTFEELPLLPISSQFCVITTFTVGRIGVPFFLMISGHLLLDREYTFENTLRFYRNHLLPLFIVSSIWYIIYDLFLHFYCGYEISLLKIILNVFYLKPISISHAWYLPTIIGLYICIPLLSNMLKNLDLKTIAIPIIFVLVFVFGRTDLNALVFLKTGSQLSSVIDFPFIGGVYGLYFIMGYLIKKEVFEKIEKIWLYISATASIIFLIILQWFSFSNGVRYTVWYDSILLFITSISLFLLFSKTNLKSNIITNTLSRYAFPIYLIHNLVILVLSSKESLPFGVVGFITIFFIPIFRFTI